MANVTPIPNVLNTSSKIGGQALLLIQRPYTNQTGIGREPASIESSHHFSVRVRWQIDLANWLFSGPYLFGLELFHNPNYIKEVRLFFGLKSAPFSKIYA